MVSPPYGAMCGECSHGAAAHDFAGKIGPKGKCCNEGCECIRLDRNGPWQQRPKTQEAEEPAFCPLCAGVGPFEQTCLGGIVLGRQNIYTCPCGARWRMGA